MKRPFSILALALLIAAVPALAVLLGLFDTWEKDVYDLLCRAQTEDGKQSELVSLVLIDKATLDWGAWYYSRHGDNETAAIFNWPWNRLVYDLIIQFLAEGGARVVAFDFELSNPFTRDHMDGDDTLGSGTRDQNGMGSPFVVHSLNFTETAKKGTEIRTLTDLEKSCLAGSSVPVEGWKESALPIDRSDLGWYTNPILPYIAILRPFEGSESLLRLGAVCTQPDSDAVIRRARAIVGYNGRCYPSLGLAAALAAIESRDGPGAYELEIADQSLILSQTGPGETVRIPLTPSGDVLVRWRDNGEEDETSLDAGYFRTYPAHRILRSCLAWLDVPQEEMAPDELLDPAEFEDRIVFVGANAPGLYDLKATPVSENYPGVKVNAAVAEGILTGDALRRLGAGVRAVLAGALAAAAVLATLRFRSTALKLAVLAGLSVAYGAASIQLFAHAQLWMDLVTPLSGVLLAYSGGTTYNYFTEGRRSREISGLFQHFAPPDVVRQLIAHPENLDTRGENRNITVFFSDIKGFTSISNTPEMRNDPGRLTDHLNAYLTEMTQAITDSGGTLDKYIGDAVVALFGAPLPMENHAREGCRAALECQQRLAAFNAQAAEAGLPPLVTRIGLYSGEATVGCVGSRDRFSYTAIGSPVNFASRLEGVNKVYGTGIMAGGPTIEQAAGAVQSRFLDRIRVPGVDEGAPPLEIHEVLAMAGGDNPLDSETLKAFERAQALYLEGRFPEAAELFDKVRKICRDGPSDIFWTRCGILTRSPPEEPWDGVFKIESK